MAERDDRQAPDERRQEARRRTDRFGWTIERKLLVLGVCVNVFGWGVGGGMFMQMSRDYQRRTEVIELAQERLPREMAETYMRKDVYSEQFYRVNETLKSLQHSIDRMNAIQAEYVADERRINERMRKQRLERQREEDQGR